MLAIQQGPANFDTSPAALITLKEQGAPQAVLNAMLSPGKPPANSSDTPPSRAGLYIQDEGQWRRLEPIQWQMQMQGMGKAMLTQGLTGAKLVGIAPRPEAPLQLTNGKPVFYFVESAEAVQERQKNPFSSDKLPTPILARFRTEKGQREMEMANRGGAGYPIRDFQTIETKRFSPTIITITPSKDLESGEYLIAMGYGLEFDFGINPNFKKSAVDCSATIRSPG